MKYTLTLIGLDAVRNDIEYGSGRPYRYKVGGLPAEHDILIAQNAHSGRWQILATPATGGAVTTRRRRTRSLRYKKSSTACNAMAENAASSHC